MKRLITLTAFSLILVIFSACTAGPNEFVKIANIDGDIAGFWDGLWHGFISPFTFIISLFNDNIGIYEIHNIGGWYNFGFILGVSIIFGGSGGGGCRAASKRK